MRTVQDNLSKLNGNGTSCRFHIHRQHVMGQKISAKLGIAARFRGQGMMVFFIKAKENGL